MKKGQSNRLSVQQIDGQGPVSIFHKDAQIHDKEVNNTQTKVMGLLAKEYPMLKFRYRTDLSKKEINDALRKVDNYLGQTLFVENARIIPDGGLIEVMDDNSNWRVFLVSEAKHQDLMVAGNAIERAYKNINEIANYMLSEFYFPYILFLEGSNFLTQNITITRPDGRVVALTYNAGSLNRLDRLTAANYGMPINTNLCENKFVKCNGATIMLQAASIYTKGEGGHWNDKDMIDVMLDVSKTSLKMLGKDLFTQITKN